MEGWRLKQLGTIIADIVGEISKKGIRDLL